MVPPPEQRTMEQELAEGIDAPHPDAPLAHPSEERPRRAPGTGRIDQDADLDSLCRPIRERAGEAASHEVVGETVHLDVHRPARAPDVVEHPRKDLRAVAKEVSVVAR